MSEAATPAAVDPAKPVETTPATPATPPTYDPEKQVVLTKEEAEQLKKDAARAAGNQRKASLYDRFASTGAFGQRPAPADDPNAGKPAAESAAKEEAKAERGLTRLALDPEYREVLDADPTLRDMFASNPLSVLSVLAPDALDAEDAIGLVKEKLAERKAKLAKKPDAPADPAKPADPVKPTPPAGGVNAGGDTPNPEYEAAKKQPHVENAVAGMIGARFKAMGTKK